MAAACGARAQRLDLSEAGDTREEEEEEHKHSGSGCASDGKYEWANQQHQNGEGERKQLKAAKGSPRTHALTLGTQAVYVPRR